MLQIDNQVITLVVLGFCIIVCFRTNSTFLCTLISSILVSIMYRSKSDKQETIINLPSFIKKIGLQKNNTNKTPKIIEESPTREKFYVNSDSIRAVSENEIETEMEIELKRNRIKNEIEYIQKKIPKDPSMEIPKDVQRNTPDPPKKDTYITHDDSVTECYTDTVIDGDESIAYNSIHRNEPTRVIMGMGKAYQNLSRYVLEEVQEIEGKEWWGNNEY